MLCDVCETIFSGGGELSPGGYDEYFHHRSARSLKAAVADGCQLCTMLRDLLPEQMLTTDWEYRITDQEDSSLQAECSQLDQPSETTSEVGVSSYRSGKFYCREWYMGRRGQNGGLKLDRLTDTTAFSLVYFRSDTLTGLPTIEFITVSSAGRAGIGGIFPVKILLFDRDNFPSKGTNVIEPEDTCKDYRYDSASTSDRSAWSAARLWLTDCAQNHGNSCSLRDSTFLPSRLMYLDDSSSSVHERIVKLCITAQLEQKDVKYMTLSHRWGDPSKIFTLTCDNIDELTLGFPLSQLPPTFRNALEFALFCDVRYVWIDALCIKQDDRQDWSAEAPLMGSVYHNSFCNLSAAGLRDPGSGLFAPRNPSQSVPIMVSPQPDLWNRESEKVIVEGRVYACMPQDFFKRTIELAPVNDRAWVMQERLLSPRKIYFSEHQLGSEGPGKKACEMFPDRIPEDASDIAPRMLGRSYERHEDFMLSVIDTVVRRQQMGLTGSLSSQKDRIRLLVAWRELQRQYVSCGITHASDRLVAVNGITKYFEQALGDECVFGLWRSQLPFQLLFLYHGQKDSSELAEGNQNVPSWSWAYHERMLELAPETANSNSDTTAGWTREALITVLDITYGEVITVPTEADGSWHTRQWPACLHLLCHLFPCMPDRENTEDTGSDANREGRVKVVVFMGGMGTTVRIKFDSRVPENASILPVFWYKQKMGWALVVSRVGGEDSRIFRRTGFMEVDASFWNLFKEYWAICSDEPDAICLV